MNSLDINHMYSQIYNVCVCVRACACVVIYKDKVGGTKETFPVIQGCICINLSCVKAAYPGGIYI